MIAAWVLFQAILMMQGVAGAWQAGANRAPAPVEHKTKFDPEMIPGIAGERVAFPLSNSRQIIRTPSGHWLVGFDIPGKGLFACYGPPTPAQGSRFSRPVLLVGNGSKGLLATGSEPAGLSFSIAARNLHIAWSDRQGVWLATAALPGALDAQSLETSLGSARPRLIAPNGVLGDVTTGPQGRPVLAYSSSEGVFAIAPSDSHSKPEKVATIGVEPVIEFDRQGRLHMAYRLQTEALFVNRKVFDPRIAYTVQTAEGWRSSQIAAQGNSFFPAIAVAGDQPVLAFQYEGLHPAGRAAGKYIEQREGGGGGIGYAASMGGSWQTGFVSQAREILTRDSSTADAFLGRIYPMVEEKWRPKLAIDKYGVPWVFWPDTTRRHTYFARWLGSRFSGEAECRGGYYAPSEYLTVEKRMPSSASEIGFAYVAAGRLYFGAVPVPSLSTVESRHLLFLDMLEVEGMHGLVSKLNRFEKYPGNPIFGPEEPGAWDDFGVNFPNVRYRGEKFTMEYSGHGSGAPAGALEHGYAESSDGIHWVRPKLGVIEKNGSAQNNLVPWAPNFLDPKDPDPEKRYKGVLVEGNWITNFRRPFAYSPDAVHWKFGPDTVNLTFLLEGGGPSFRDDRDIPERRFKAVGRTISQGHRALGMMWSPDLIHWYGEEAVLDVEDPYGRPAQQWRGRYVAGRILDPAGEKGGDQIYWGTVWIENGLYMLLYAPMQYDGGYQAALAVSRDGFNYIRIQNGEFILPRGPAGAWDSGIIAVGYGINTPLHIGEKIRVYYGGNTWHHGTDPFRAAGQIGMAEIRTDGWTYLKPSDDATAGYFTTIPISVDPARSRKLFLNAELPKAKGEIRVEILSVQENAPLAGYSQKDCSPVQSDSTRAQVSWKGGRAIPGNAGPVRLRFYLSGVSTRLFSYWFE